MKCDAMIRFNFGNYDINISDDEWCMMWNQLLYIKDERKDVKLNKI